MLSDEEKAELRVLLEKARWEYGHALMTGVGDNSSVIERQHAALLPWLDDFAEEVRRRYVGVWAAKFESLAEAHGNEEGVQRASRNVFELCADYLRASVDYQPAKRP